MTGGEILSRRATLLETKGEKVRAEREKIDRGSHSVMTRKV
jgi:hypothetical protein